MNLTPTQRRYLDRIADGRAYQSRAMFDLGASHHPAESRRLSDDVLGKLTDRGLIYLDPAANARRAWRLTEAGARVVAGQFTTDDPAPSRPAPAAEPTPQTSAPVTMTEGSPAPGTTPTDQGDTLLEVLVNALGTATWPGGDPMVKMALRHRVTLGQHLADAIRGHLAADDDPWQTSADMVGRTRVAALDCTCGPGPDGEEPDYRPGCPRHGEATWQVMRYGYLRLAQAGGNAETVVSAPWAAGWLIRALVERDHAEAVVSRAFVPPF